MTTDDGWGCQQCAKGGASVLRRQGGYNVCHRGSRGEEEKGGGGTVVRTTTTKATEDDIGWGAAGAPLLSALPPWRWSVHHLGTSAEDAAAGGELVPSSCNDEGTSAAQ